MMHITIDVATDIYTYLGQWWGLKNPILTDKKCELLAKSVREWRRAYKHGEYKKLEKMYDSDRALTGYLAAFGTRYAYTLYFLLKKCKLKHNICANNDVLRACYIGGGPGIDIIGLLAYLYERKTPPRDMELHFIDRSPQWRRFHNYLFGSILPKYFPKTRALPYYHDVDLNDSTPRYDPLIHRVFESRLFVLSNVLSELPDANAIREHMRFLLRCSKVPCYLVVADSNAKKLRPRLSWLSDFVDNLGFPYYLQYNGSYDVSCSWLDKDITSARIFSEGGPSFLTSMKRRGFVSKLITNKNGENRTKS
jgi:hypothetical protein